MQQNAHTNFGRVLQAAGSVRSAVGYSALLAAGLVLGGCASPFSLPSPFANNGGQAGAAPEVAVPDQSVVTADQIQAALPERSQPSIGDQMVGSARNVWSAVTDAFKIQPRRVPADDPTRLDSQPGEVGSDLYYHAARVHESQNNIPQAVSQYQQALQINPQDVRSRVGLARLYDRTGERLRAEQLYLEAAQMQPQNAAVLNDLALCYAKQGQIPAAVDTLARAVQLKPRELRYRNNLAAILVEAGRVEEAFQHLSVVHGPAIAHYNVGYLLSQHGQIAPARQHFNMALRADPGLEPARQMLSQLAATGSPRPVSSPVSSGPRRPRDPSSYAWPRPTGQRVPRN